MSDDKMRANMFLLLVYDFFQLSPYVQSSDLNRNSIGLLDLTRGSIPKAV